MTDGPIPAARLAAQVRSLRRLVTALERRIALMESSRFWKLRNLLVGWRGGSALRESTPVDTLGDDALDDDALLRLQAVRDPADLAWLASIARKLPLRETFAIVVEPGTLSEVTMASLHAQLYPHWRIAAPGESDFETDYVLGVRAGDRLDPEALLAIAIAMDDGADVVYTESDGPAGVSGKPDWSPETLLGYDYVDALCAFRTARVRACGGGEPAASGLRWYDLLLRVSETPVTIVHLPRVLVTRADASPTQPPAWRAIVEATAARRGEPVVVEEAGALLAPRYLLQGEPRVAIVIPTHDREDLLAACLASIFTRSTYRAIEVVVVDDRSTSAALAALLHRYAAEYAGQFRVVRSDEPFHFSRLVNAGVAATDAPFVVLLNNDTEIVEPQWIELLLGQAQRAAIGAVGALLLYPDQTIQHAGFVLGAETDGGDHALRGLRLADAASTPQAWLDTNYAAVTGACLMIDRAKFVAAGGFDDAFAVEYGDVDLCLRLAAAGYRNVVVPRARLYHHEMASRGPNDRIEKRVRAQAERAAFAERWGNYLQHDPFYRRGLARVDSRGW